ncbi:MAG TPA: hypothetical protein VHY35_18935 [Stellaceae bacterium]|jgi:hypothetical protein|nr:hypothetical protein [Stellaceae bacterium]
MRSRGPRSKDEQVELLLRKTVENGATPGEEVAAIQLAYLIARQNGIDPAIFKTALEKIGDPPRYMLTADGFLVPTHVTRPAAARDTGERRRWTDAHGTRGGAERTQAAPDRECPVSPTGRHRMERYMRGTFPTGMQYCLHCGLRTPD